MPKPPARFTIFTMLLWVANLAHAQSPHYAAEQELNIWYNPALKTDKLAAAQVNFRNVTYPGLIAYSSKAATVALPLVSNGDTTYDNTKFVTLSAGVNVDNASNNFMAASAAMMGLSYALPLNDDNTYIAIGLQAYYAFNRVGTGTSLPFPAQFDKYGALSASMAADPAGSGYNFGYFAVGIGAAVFHSSDNANWYIGASMRQLNHPYTEWGRAARLPSLNSIQSGYTAYISRLNQLGVYGNLSWQGGSITQTFNERFIGLSFSHHFNDSTGNNAWFGVSLRAADAVIPAVGLQLGRYLFAGYYEINAPGNPNGSYGRSAFDISFRLYLVKP